MSGKSAPRLIPSLFPRIAGHIPTNNPRNLNIAHRSVHDMSSEISAGDLNMKAPVYMVWGAGTDVGKTLISAGICYASSQISVLYFPFSNSARC